MNNTPTPHNTANFGEFAKTVLMPGDPLRSKFIAEKFLTDAKLINNVRGVQGYTGLYKGIPISIMAHGMGMPSMGIYSYELFNFYGVENIIRIGTCGARKTGIELRDVIIAKNAMTNSSFGKQLGYKKKEISASEKLVENVINTIKENNKTCKIGKIFTSDIFYGKDKMSKKADKQCFAVEMETFGLYVNAKNANKNALAILTVSDNNVTGERLTIDDRQTSFEDMVKLALETAIKL